MVKTIGRESKRITKVVTAGSYCPPNNEMRSGLATTTPPRQKGRAIAKLKVIPRSKTSLNFCILSLSYLLKLGKIEEEIRLGIT